MAQSRIERNPRTASLPAVSRCAKYAVRGLVLAGFAGVAWLLSASAAHASDQPDLLSPVTSLLTGAGLPGQQQYHQQHGDRMTGIVLAALGPVAKAAPPVTTPVTGAVTSTVHRTVTLHRAPVQTVDRARTNRSATADASSAKHASSKRSAKAGILRTYPKRTQEPVVQTEPVRNGASGDIAAAATGAHGAGVDPAVSAARATARLRALRAAEGLDGAHAKPVVNRNVAQGTNHVPLLPRPAPVPAPPAVGLAVGAPGAGSGLDKDGGATAALPAVPAGAKVLTFRPDAVENVELRLLAAEKPTVSPD